MNLDGEEIYPIKKEPLDEEMAEVVEFMPVRRVPPVAPANGMSCVVLFLLCGLWFIYFYFHCPSCFRWSRPLWTRPLWLCASPPRL